MTTDDTYIRPAQATHTPRVFFWQSLATLVVMLGIVALCFGAAAFWIWVVG